MPALFVWRLITFLFHMSSDHFRFLPYSPFPPLPFVFIIRFYPHPNRTPPQPPPGAICIPRRASDAAPRLDGPPPDGPVGAPGVTQRPTASGPKTRRVVTMGRGGRVDPKAIAVGDGGRPPPPTLHRPHQFVTPPPSRGGHDINGPPPRVPILVYRAPRLALWDAAPHAVRGQPPLHRGRGRDQEAVPRGAPVGLGGGRVANVHLTRRMLDSGSVLFLPQVCAQSSRAPPPDKPLVLNQSRT